MRFACLRVNQRIPFGVENRCAKITSRRIRQRVFDDLTRFRIPLSDFSHEVFGEPDIPPTVSDQPMRFPNRVRGWDIL